MVMAVFAYIYHQSFVVPQNLSVEMILDQVLCWCYFVFYFVCQLMNILRNGLTMVYSRYSWTYHSMNNKLYTGGWGKYCNKGFKAILSSNAKGVICSLLLQSLFRSGNGKRYFVHFVFYHLSEKRIKGFRKLSRCVYIYILTVDVSFPISWILFTQVFAYTFICKWEAVFV